MTRLRIIRPDNRRSDLDLGDRGRIRVGRSRKNDVALPDPAASRHHAELLADPTGWEVRDLGSRNRTYVNGVPIEAPRRLRPGDEIVIGRSRLIFDGEASSDSGTVTDEHIFSLDTQVIDPGQIEQVPAGRSSDWIQLLETAHHTLAGLSPDRLAPALLDVVFQALQPERGAVFLRGPGDDHPVCLVSRDIDGHEVEVPREVIDEAVEDGNYVLMNDAVIGGDRKRPRSLVAVPLEGPRGTRGAVYIDARLDGRRFQREDVRLLSVLTGVASLQSRVRNLMEADLEVRRRREDAEEAAEIQRRLLPEESAHIDGYEYSWLYEACYEVSGDYCDYHTLDEGRQGLVLADVAGHGFGSAMLMALTHATLRVHLDTGTPLHRLAAAMNDSIFRSTPVNRFVTFFFAMLDPSTHELGYVNAGHNPAPVVVRHDGSVEELRAASIPLGMLPDLTCPPGAFRLEPGELLVACTDGITESQDARSEMFGEERLIDLVVRHRHLDATALRDTVDRAVREHGAGMEQRDDVTLMILKRIHGS